LSLRRLRLYPPKRSFDPLIFAFALEVPTLIVPSPAPASPYFHSHWNHSQSGNPFPPSCPRWSFIEGTDLFLLRPHFARPPPWGLVGSINPAGSGLLVFYRSTPSGGFFPRLSPSPLSLPPLPTFFSPLLPTPVPPTNGVLVRLQTGSSLSQLPSLPPFLGALPPLSRPHLHL